jgi:hypothetical protein
MGKRGLMAVVGLLMLSFGFIVSCNKSSSPTAAASILNGVWYAESTVVSTQLLNPDTFSTKITITGTNYDMMRYTYLHSSSGGVVDSVEELGTIASVPSGVTSFAQGDSIVFTPKLTKQFMDNTFAWDTCTSNGVPCQASTPSSYKVKIVDTLGSVFWDDSFPDCSGEDYILWHLKKQ